jgi:hypothetical protein
MFKFCSFSVQKIYLVILDMKIFECEFCGKQFPRLYFLTRHYERKYKCYTKNEVFVLTEEECLNKTLNEPIIVKKINDNLHDEPSDEMSDNLNNFGTQIEIQNKQKDEMNNFGTQIEIQNEPNDKLNHFEQNTKYKMNQY